MVQFKYPKVGKFNKAITTLRLFEINSLICILVYFCIMSFIIIFIVR